LQRYFLKLSYKGSNYHGWQCQDNAKSVQSELNDVLSKFLGHQVQTMGCGRTDTGVHARAFFAHFDTVVKIENHQAFIFKLNKMLPFDIALHSLFEVHQKAHARFDALSRTYEYTISREKDPFALESSYYVFGPLDIDLMNQASELLKEFVDFSAFSKSKTQVMTNNCKIFYANWTEQNQKLIFKIKADRFLRNMVRAIVGTMIQVGSKKLSLEAFRNVILSKNRSKAGYSVPAEGLALVNIEYPKELINEQS
jgi:tRNA pseudouridine38-40 synthase